MLTRTGHLTALDLFAAAINGIYPAGIERHTPASARLLARGRAAMAVKSLRMARERAAYLRGLPIGDDYSRLAARELRQLRNARVDHSYFVGVTRKLAETTAEPLSIAAE